MAGEQDDADNYLAAHGGPFYDLQLKLGLLRENALNAGRRAVLLVVLAWAVPLLLAAIAGRAYGDFASRPFLLDPGAWARYLIAIAAFILMEPLLERSLKARLEQFMRLLPQRCHGQASASVAWALGRRDSRAAEAACLVLAAAGTLLSLINLHHQTQSFWGANVDGGTVSLTPAGWWCLVVSNPILYFLFLRSLWRHWVWSVMLRKLSRLDMKLVATHPDRNGGLGFIGEYPNAYTLFVFGVSCVIAAALASQIAIKVLNVAAVTSVSSIWLAIVLALFAYPLAAFQPPLSALKRETLFRCNALATQYFRNQERSVLGANTAVSGEDGEADATDVADPSKVLDAAKKMSSVLVHRSALVPVGLAALVPIMAAGMVKLPFKELLSIVKKLLLL